MKGLFSKAALVLPLLIFMFSIFGAVWQGQYSTDYAHWGSMISNAKDLSDGLAPYKNIYILYGFLTTLIHAVSYQYFGGNLLSLISVTSIFYAIGLLLVYRIAEYISEDKKIGLGIVLIYFLIHPFAIYPWSNYLAFPFLLSGLLASLKQLKSPGSYFFCGFAFALAVLTREGLFPSVLIYMIAVIVLDVVNIKEEKFTRLKNGISIFYGFTLPIALFLFYLKWNGVFNYWLSMSWNLPQLYAAEFFPHMKGIGLIIPLIKQISNGVVNLDVRWILILVVIVVNASIVVVGVFNSNFRENNTNNIKIALLSTFLLSSALHLPEIFRLATGALIGLINVFIYIKNIQVRNILFLVIAALLMVTIAPKGSGHNFSTTNYFWPNEDKLNNAILVKEPRYFRYQKWEQTTIDFYTNIQRDLTVIQKVCRLKFHYNMTQDSFLVVLSPFERYQIAAHWTSEPISNLRSDLNIQKKLQNDQDILIFQELINGSSDAEKVSEGFVLYKKYKTPRTTPIYRDTSMNIYIPESCAKELIAK